MLKKKGKYILLIITSFLLIDGIYTSCHKKTYKGDLLLSNFQYLYNESLYTLKLTAKNKENILWTIINPENNQVVISYMDGKKIRYYNNEYPMRYYIYDDKGLKYIIHPFLSSRENGYITSWGCEMKRKHRLYDITH